ncbi:MAG TPA: histidine kinase, partial [Solirubrobacteraceae bacterium]|nr:histidine kinase [Solirubrobacteraceae bacterium]
SRETAARAISHLRALTGADAVAVCDLETVLAVDGAVPDGVEADGPLAEGLAAAPNGRVHVEPALGAVVAPLRIGDELVGSLCAFRAGRERLRPEDARVLGEAALLVSAQLELSAVAAQEERLAEAELRALRAQISPHFIYNALAAVASYIRSRPEEARELLTEFAEFIRYAFRRERPYVTLADELHYVQKYLRLEQARFGERLEVRVQVAPEVLGAVVPVLSLQPLVENAVRHGVESRPGVGHVEITGRDVGPDVELCVRDDGAGMAPERARAALAGGPGAGIGLSNVDARLRQTFGADYGLAVESEPGAGTCVTMTVPKFRAGVRAA